MSWDASGRLLWQQCVPDVQLFAGAGHVRRRLDRRHRQRRSISTPWTQTEQRLKVLDAVTGAAQADVRTRYPDTLFALVRHTDVASVTAKTWIVQSTSVTGNATSDTDGGDDLVVSVWTTGTALGAAPWPTFKRTWPRTGGPLPEPPPQPVDSSDASARRDGRTGDTAIMNLTPVRARAPATDCS